MYSHPVISTETHETQAEALKTLYHNLPVNKRGGARAGVFFLSLILTLYILFQ